MYFLSFFTELFFLFLLSRTFTRELSWFLYRMIRSQHITMYIIAFLFLPGTIIHELSHYLMAVMLRVHAGNIHLFPEMAGDNIKMGTVAIAKTDPIRRFFIGAAPFFCGTSLILITISLSIQYNIVNNSLFLILLGYLIFEIGNTMFSSRKDMEGALELLLAIGIVSVLLMVIGFRFSIEQYIPLDQLNILFQKASIFIAPALIIDIVLVSILKIVNRR